MKILSAILALAVFVSSASAAPTAVTVVTGAEGGDDQLVKYAAAELKTHLEEICDVTVAITKQTPEGTVNVILLGNPETNSAIGKSNWPTTLSDQGQVLKSTKDGLIIGGGSSVATLWAAYEFLHSFGMRSLTNGDYSPIDTPVFSLTEFDTVLEPTAKVRDWRIEHSGPASQESWGSEENKKFLVQLSKLKFNQVTFVFREKRSSDDLAKNGNGALRGGEEFVVSGETAGRSVFDGAKIFENPDYIGIANPEERAAADLQLRSGIVSNAERLGMKVIFEKAAPGSDPEFQIISPGQKKGGLLPHFYTGNLPEAAKGKGFAVEGNIPGDLDMDIYFLSAAAFGKITTEAEALDSLVTPICGEGVADSLAIGFAAIKAVSALIEKEDPEFAVADPKMFMKHYESGEPVPGWWAKAKEHYGTAVNEMYRGNTRARGGARPFILYYAKRYTFALHYMTAVEHVRLAGIARKEKDDEAWVENLELSVQEMHNALSIYADVARDNSDRGVIAVLNKYAYRPLLSALEETPLP